MNCAVSDGGRAGGSLAALSFSSGDKSSVPRNNEEQLHNVQCSESFSVLNNSAKCNMQFVKWLPWRDFKS